VRVPLASLSDVTSRYDAWLIDLDGTLYWQLPVRLAMGAELLLFGVSHIRLIRYFRQQQEAIRAASEAGGCPYRLQLERTARANGCSASTADAIVTEWMHRRPGKWLRLCRRNRLIAQIGAYRIRGGKTALVSDYPARDKLGSLRASHLFDIVLACGEPDGPANLKPSPEGFLNAATRLKVEPAHCLVIGDRDDADGEAARRAGMDFCLLK
jgi:putative hydrolase of the HAD superfamily